MLIDWDFSKPADTRRTDGEYTQFLIETNRLDYIGRAPGDLLPLLARKMSTPVTSTKMTLSRFCTSWHGSRSHKWKQPRPTITVLRQMMAGKNPYDTYWEVPYQGAFQRA